MKTYWMLLILLLAPLASGLTPPLPDLQTDTPDATPGAPIITEPKDAPRDLVAASDVVPRRTDDATPQRDEPAFGPVTQGGSVPMPANAYGRLLTDLSNPQLDPATLTQAVDAYYRSLGMGPPSELHQFDENSSVAYTHSIGDIDFDGHGDMLLDTLCTAYYGCPDMSDQIDVNGQRVISFGSSCGEPHGLRVISGDDGKEIWNMSLDDAHEMPGYLGIGCSLHYVVGMVPMGDGTFGPLVYRYDAFSTLWEFVEIRHTLFLIEPRAGNVVWEWQETGSLYTDLFVNTIADNVVIHPNLDVQNLDGLQFGSNETAMSLNLAMVGFNMTTASSLLSPYGFNGPVVVLQNYQPTEWAARLNPQTGDELWRADTWSPDPTKSVIPFSHWGPGLVMTPPGFDLSYDFFFAVNTHNWYWNDGTCCHDVDGDGITDVLYTTLEYTNHPSSNTDGPYGYESRLAAFSGVDGSPLYEQYLKRNDQSLFLNTGLQKIGDVDGDGDHDYIARMQSVDPRTVHVLSLRDGSTGDEMWRIEGSRIMDLLPVGDVDGDGGTDLALLEWFQIEYTFGIVPPYANVTHTPLKVFQGATGDLLWRGESFMAAVDIQQMFTNARLNGFPDIDGDGVMDIPLSDPIYLPDGTTIHQTSFVSPVTGKRLAEAVTVGAFSIPIGIGDVSGDGRDEFLILNGDVLDLWVTVYDGKSGKADWSRRISELRISSYTSALPIIRTHDMPREDASSVDVVINFQMAYATFGGYIFTASVSQQIAGLRGSDGELQWAQPKIYDESVVPAREGASPASEIFAEHLEPEPLSSKISALAPSPLFGTLSFLMAGLAAFLITRRFSK